MNLVIDVGNTQLKAALFEKNELIEHMLISLDSLQTINEIIQNHHLSRIGLSKVRDLPEELVEILNKRKEILFEWDKDFALPIKLNYKTPQTLGHDRICNAVAAKFLFEYKNVLIIDLGTCNKYDFVDVNGVYHGGSISPGFEMRFSAMNYFTDQLPLLQVENADDLIGDSTQNSMKSGAFFGMLGEINYFMEQYKSKFNDIEIILTGGFSTYFDKVVKNHIFADPYLTLKGLNIILNFQKEK
jgi:type III pantothenate kinase